MHSLLCERRPQIMLSLRYPKGYRVFIKCLLQSSKGLILLFLTLLSCDCIEFFLQLGRLKVILRICSIVERRTEIFPLAFPIISFTFYFILLIREVRQDLHLIHIIRIYILIILLFVIKISSFKVLFMFL